MIIKVSELNHEQEIVINGNEDWLVDLYRDFPPRDLSTCKLQAHLKLTSATDDSVLIKGHIKYDPQAVCYGCNEPIHYPLNFEFATQFYGYNPFANKRDITLKSDEIDRYYIENDCINIEGLIVDEISTHLPSNLEASEVLCPQCRSDGGTNHVDLQSIEPLPKDNPFLRLKDLKL